MSSFPIKGLTSEGLEFLKAVFAAPDFQNQGTFAGIPDEAAPDVVAYRHLRVAPLDMRELDELFNMFVIVQLPVPGIAFFTAAINPHVGVAPDTIFHPVLFDDCKDLFTDLSDVGGNHGRHVADKITAFREAGRALELICTSNQMTWKGSIRAFKLNIKATTGDSTSSLSSTVPKVISGLDGINSNSQAQYVAPANLGCYMMAGKNDVKFNVQDIVEKWIGPNSAQDGTVGLFSSLFSGFGDLEANVMIIEDNYDTVNRRPFSTFQTRAWAIAEYMPVPNTPLAKAARKSPKHDVVAMAAYQRILQEMPVAVTYYENAKFWDTILKLLKGGVGIAKNIPGPYGAIAGGVGTVIEGIESLFN